MLSRAIRRIGLQSRPFLPQTRSKAMSTTTTLPQWDRLIRYVSAQDHQTYYGEPILEHDKTDIDALVTEKRLRVKRLSGATAMSVTRTDHEDLAEKLLSPLAREEVPIIRCTGLNYLSHSPYPSPPDTPSPLTLIAILQSKKPKPRSPKIPPSSSNPARPSRPPKHPSPSPPSPNPLSTTKANSPSSSAARRKTSGRKTPRRTSSDIRSPTTFPAANGR